MWRQPAGFTSLLPEANAEVPPFHRMGESSYLNIKSASSNRSISALTTKHSVSTSMPPGFFSASSKWKTACIGPAQEFPNENSAQGVRS
jgi:hypothetical protein